MVVLVDDAGEVGGDQVAAPVDVAGQLLGQGFGNDVQDGRDDQAVAVQRSAGRDHVGAHAQPQEGRVPVQRLLPVPQPRGGVGILLAGPPRLPVEEDRNGRAQTVRSGGRGEVAQGRAERGDGAEQLAVGAGVGHHRGVVLLGAGNGLPPLEEADGIGAVRDVQEGVAGQFARLLGPVDGLPVDGAGGVFHQEPGLPAREVAGEVRRERQLVQGLRAGPDVVVVGDEVDLGGPVGVVHALGLAHHHEVGGDRHAGGDARQHLTLGAQVVLQRVGGEAFEVELLRGVGVRGGEPGRQDLLEVGVPLGPERRAPGVVEGLDAAVARAQPDAEGAGRVVRVVVDVVAAQFVADVPGDEGGVAAVALRQRRDQAQGVGAEDGGGGPPVLAGAGPHRLAGGGHGQDLGVRRRQPRRRGSGRGGQVDADAAVVQQVHHLVQPAEVPGVPRRLEAGPGEYRERDDGDSGLAHEADVLAPDLLRPLFRVVVGAVLEAVGGAVRGGGPERPAV